MKLKSISMADIRSWKPCYDPIKHVPEDFKGDVLTLLDNKNIPFRDRLWCVLRTSLVSEKLMWLYAIKAAGTVEHLMKDERSKTALRVAEAFVNGTATRAEFDVARREARDARYDAAYAYAYAAAAFAADAAADAFAAADAYAAAAAFAADAADAAACRIVHQEKQIMLLRELIVKGIETGDSVIEKEV